MKAVKLNGAGGVEVLDYTDVADPVPGHGDVLVQVAAAGVNFMDVGKRRGLKSAGYDPEILGVEGAGRVLEVGPGVSDFVPGDRVAWVFVPHSYAERIVAPAASLVAIPDGIDDKIAASLMMQGLTASHFATDFYPVKKGDIALVHAAAGGVGQLLTQIIKARGGTVIGRVSSEAKVEAAETAGADHVIVDADGNFVDEVIRLSGGEGVHVVFDGSGPATFDGSLSALRRSGTFCWYGPVLGADSQIAIMSLPRSIKLGYGVFLDHIPTTDLLRQRSAQLFDWVLEGKLRVAPPTEFALSDAADAHQALESRSTTGKLLLFP
jgi:NADPH2:quinone reductase